MFAINLVLYLILITLVCSILTILVTVWAGWIAITVFNSLIYLLNKYDSESYSFDPAVNWRGTGNF